MTEIFASVEWKRDEYTFRDNRYSRVHTWRFDGGAEVRASSSPHIVPEPMSDATAVDPEEAFVASLSSCHMLWFLSIAAKRGFVVDEYVDKAVGVMGRGDEGKLVMLEVRLQPATSWDGNDLPTDVEVEEMHQQAHEECFIANSVRTKVSVQPSM